MKPEVRCNSCAYLYEDEQGRWICDLYQKEIHRVADEDCPVEDDSTEWGNEEEYRTVYIPNVENFHSMWEMLVNNNYDVIADPEAHTLDIWEEQFIEADDILTENEVNHKILF